LDIHFLFAEGTDGFVQFFNFFLQLALVVLDLHRFHRQRQFSDLVLGLLLGGTEVVQGCLALFFGHESGAGGTLFALGVLRSLLDGILARLVLLLEVCRDLAVRLMFLINRFSRCRRPLNGLIRFIFLDVVAGLALLLCARVQRTLRLLI